jgi:hypothetical protein
LRINPAEPNKVLINFDVRNRSSSALSNVNISLVELPQVKVASSIASRSSSSNGRLVVEVASPVRPLNLSGNASFLVGGSNCSVPLEVTIPASVFVQPLAISESQFASILTSGTQLFHAAANVHISGDSHSDITKLAELLHVKVIKNQDAVALYGKTLQNHHVCILVKAKTGSMSVDIKATDSTLSASLIAEVKKAFH